MIGKIILGTYIGLEIFLHILLWGENPKWKRNTKVGWKTLINFVIDFLIIALGVIYW
jgi:hypothetical protein